MGRRGVRAQERRAEVDVDDGIPVRRGEIREGVLHIDRRHVDQDVETAERVDDRLNQVCGGIRL